MWLHDSMLFPCKYENSDACPMYKFLMAGEEGSRFLQLWNLLWVKLCFIWLFIIACPLLPPICPSWKLLLLSQMSEFVCCRNKIKKKVSLRFFFPPPVNVVQGRARSEMTLFLKECTFSAIGRKALSCWRVPCVRLAGTAQSEAVVSNCRVVRYWTLKLTLICKECLNGLGKIDY